MKFSIYAIAYFTLGANTWAQDSLPNAQITEIENDRIESVYSVSQEVQASAEYRQLLQQMDELRKTVERLEQENQGHKGEIIKTIGFTSAVAGFLSSAWQVWEKSLGVQSALQDIKHKQARLNSLKAEVEQLKSNPHANPNELANKNRKLGSLQSEIKSLGSKMRISRIGYWRGMFKGASSGLLFGLTFFLDDIVNWAEKKIYPRLAVRSFLNSWNQRVMYAGIAGSNSMSPEQKAMFFFADSETLGVSEEIFLEELHRYKRSNPSGYQAFRAVAEAGLKSTLMNQLFGEINHVSKMKKWAVLDDWSELQDWTTPIDNTRVHLPAQFQK